MERHSVKLREKKLTNGMLGLYLDYYPPIIDPKTGKSTRRDHLKIHIYEKPKTTAEKELTRVGRIKAESIRSEKEMQLLNRSFDFLDKLSEKMDFLAYFLDKAKKRNSSKGNYDNWYGAYKYLCLYTNNQCKFGDVDEKFCQGFKEFLGTVKSIKSNTVGLAPNSQVSYFNKFKAAVKEAFEERLFSINPILRVKGIPQAETQREYLTLEELKAIFDTECDPPILKRASIFSALTGMRWSDIVKLSWKDVQHSAQSGYFIRFSQQKTKGMETLPITEQAFEQLGGRGKQEDIIFSGLKYSAYTNVLLSRWMLQAGITKKITFHNFRHTHAVLLISNGVDIYTVSKMLGHRHLKTTEIYAKVIDSKKIEAANKIKL